jgi:hypothetical protein
MTIDTLAIRLPAGYALSAGRIARLVAAELRTLPVPRPGRLDRLAVPPIRLGAGLTDEAVARTIADAIGVSLVHEHWS